jgi:Uma2 family endonuclease
MSPKVLSPSMTAWDRASKLPVYAREGVRYVWLVDPELCTLKVFRLEGAHYALLVTRAGKSRVLAEPFEAFELELAYLWGET